MKIVVQSLWSRKSEGYFSDPADRSAIGMERSRHIQPILKK